MDVVHQIVVVLFVILLAGISYAAYWQWKKPIFRILPFICATAFAMTWFDKNDEFLKHILVLNGVAGFFVLIWWAASKLNKSKKSEVPGSKE